MYVDIPEGKISTPKQISKVEAEGFYFDAFKLIQYMELVLSNYELADPKEKERRRLEMLKNSKMIQENFEKASLSIQESKRALIRGTTIKPGV
jgi:hypothetical protein